MSLFESMFSAFTRRPNRSFLTDDQKDEIRNNMMVPSEVNPQVKPNDAQEIFSTSELEMLDKTPEEASTTARNLKAKRTQLDSSSKMKTKLTEEQIAHLTSFKLDKQRHPLFLDALRQNGIEVAASLQQEDDKLKLKRFNLVGSRVGKAPHELIELVNGQIDRRIVFAQSFEEADSYFNNYMGNSQNLVAKRKATAIFEYLLSDGSAFDQARSMERLTQLDSRFSILAKKTTRAEPDTTKSIEAKTEQPAKQQSPIQNEIGMHRDIMRTYDLAQETENAGNIEIALGVYQDIFDNTRNSAEGTFGAQYHALTKKKIEELKNKFQSKSNTSDFEISPLEDLIEDRIARTEQEALVALNISQAEMYQFRLATGFAPEAVKLDSNRIKTLEEKAQFRMTAKDSTIAQRVKAFDSAYMQAMKLETEGHLFETEGKILIAEEKLTDAAKIYLKIALDVEDITDSNGKAQEYFAFAEARFANIVNDNLNVRKNIVDFLKEKQKFSSVIEEQPETIPFANNSKTSSAATTIKDTNTEPVAVSQTSSQDTFTLPISRPEITDEKPTTIHVDTIVRVPVEALFLDENTMAIIPPPDEIKPTEKPAISQSQSPELQKTTLDKVVAKATLRTSVASWISQKVSQLDNGLKDLEDQEVMELTNGELRKDAAMNYVKGQIANASNEFKDYATDKLNYVSEGIKNALTVGKLALKRIAANKPSSQNENAKVEIVPINIVEDSLIISEDDSQYLNVVDTKEEIKASYVNKHAKKGALTSALITAAMTLSTLMGTYVQPNKIELNASKPASISAPVDSRKAPAVDINSYQSSSPTSQPSNAATIIPTPTISSSPSTTQSSLEEKTAKPEIVKKIFNKNETVWGAAKNYYGRSDLIDLVEVTTENGTKVKDKSKVRQGRPYILTFNPVPVEKLYDPKPEGKYSVRNIEAGDIISQLAVDYLGSVKKIDQIIVIGPDGKIAKNFNNVQAGSKAYIPTESMKKNVKPKNRERLYDTDFNPTEDVVETSSIDEIVNSYNSGKKTTTLERTYGSDIYEVLDSAKEQGKLARWNSEYARNSKTDGKSNMQIVEDIIRNGLQNGKSARQYASEIKEATKGLGIGKTAILNLKKEIQAKELLRQESAFSQYTRA